MQKQVPGSRNQVLTSKTHLNADNEDNVMVLGDEWEDLFGDCMEITGFNRFSSESSNEDDIDVNYNNE